MKKAVSMGLIGLTALSIAGNFLISLPLSSDDGSDILGSGIAVILSFLAVIFLYPPLTKLFSKDIRRWSRPEKILLSAAYILIEAALIYTAVITLTEFSEFVGSVMLPNVHISVIFAVFTAAAALISRKGAALSKTAVVLLFIAAALVVTIFLFSIPKMSFKYIVPTGFPDIFTSLKISLSVFLKSFAGALLPIAVAGRTVKGIKSVLIGNAAGAGIVMLCMFNTLLVFGGGFASTLRYPYTSAVSTVAMGEIFSGMDGFLYVTVIFTCIVKTALIFHTTRMLANKLSEIKKLIKLRFTIEIPF